MIHLRNFLSGVLLWLVMTTTVRGQTNTNATAWTFKKGTQWQDTTVRLIVADAAKADGETFQEVKAKWATYELTPEIKLKLTPRAPYTTVPDKLEIVTFHDPHTKKVIFINKHQFYVSRPEGVTGFRPFFWQLWHSDSFMELAGLSGLGGEAADIEFFEKTFDVQKAVSAMIGPYEERVIFFKHALPDGYFSNDHQLFPSELKNAEMTKGILRLDLWNSHRKTPASVWFDVKAKKVIRARADGEEKEISDPEDWSQPNKHPWSGVYFRNDSGSINPESGIEEPAITVTLLPNDNMIRRRRDGTREAYEKSEQVEIKTTRLLRAFWLYRKDQGMEMAYIPVKYHPYLLKEPIVATITKVGNISGGLPIAQFNSVEVVLDKGRQAGVLEGMEFYYLTQNGYGEIKVKTVSDNSAEGVAKIYGENGMRPESGRKVSTRFPSRPVPFSGEAEAQWDEIDAGLKSEPLFKSR